MNGSTVKFCRVATLTISSSPLHQELGRDGDTRRNAGKGSVSEVIQGLRECGGLQIIRICAPCTKY